MGWESAGRGGVELSDGGELLLDPAKLGLCSLGLFPDGAEALAPIDGLKLPSLLGDLSPEYSQGLHATLGFVFFVFRGIFEQALERGAGGCLDLGELNNWVLNDGTPPRGSVLRVPARDRGASLLGGVGCGQRGEGAEGQGSRSPLRSCGPPGHRRRVGGVLLRPSPGDLPWRVGLQWRRILRRRGRAGVSILFCTSSLRRHGLLFCPFPTDGANCGDRSCPSGLRYQR